MSHLDNLEVILQQKNEAGKFVLDDKQMEDFFWMFVSDFPGQATKALKLVEKHRSDLAKKIYENFLEKHLISLQVKD